MKKYFPKNINIGVDIEDINRFEKFHPIKKDFFLDKIFTKKEQKYCFSNKRFSQHLAGRFAGKEAVIKALNCFGKTNINYKDIEIFNDKIGVPAVRLSNNKFNDLRVHISLSHCEDKAIAFAMVTMGDL